MSTKSFLDVDDSFLESKLRLPEKDEEEKEFNKILDTITNMKEKPSIIIHPTPAICVKAKSSCGEKTFINICTSDDIPPPAEISQEKLLEMLMNEEANYVIPLSIGQEKKEADIHGVLSPTYDVLINKQYFDKCLKMESFMVFTLNVIFDGVNDKFKKSLNLKDHVVLKNRKVMGKLQPHRIEKRAIKKPEELAPLVSRPLIQEMDSKLTLKSKNIDDTSNRSLECVILKNKNEEDKHLTGLFRIPSMSLKNVSVDIGEDRVIVEDHESNRFVDVFLPERVNQETAQAYMDSKIGILRLHMPILQT